MERIPNNDDLDKVKIYSNQDSELEYFGKILSNNKSRIIYSLLINEELSSLEIHKRTDISMPLIHFHLKTMLLSKIIEITKKTYYRKFEIKHYRAKSVILITGKKRIPDIIKDKTFLKSLAKLTSVILAAFSYGFYNITQNSSQLSSSIDSNNLGLQILLIVIGGLSIIGYLRFRKKRILQNIFNDKIYKVENDDHLY